MHLAAIVPILLTMVANEATPQALERQCRVKRHGPSCYKLGFLYSFARGVEKDLPKAAALFKEACDLETAPGCHDLALMYERGNGVTKDPARARRLYEEEIRLTEKACREGQEFPCKLLQAWRSKGWMSRE